MRSVNARLQILDDGWKKSWWPHLLVAFFTPGDFFPASPPGFFAILADLLGGMAALPAPQVPSLPS